MQSLADSTGLEVERPESIEMSILGVAFLAGLQCGMKKFELFTLLIIFLIKLKNFTYIIFIFIEQVCVLIIIRNKNNLIKIMLIK